ncbi:SAC3/GANP/Nin1/mts3/eIF-3 p25 family-domain-containing protein [Ampelomyces quisqualis]|uniref:SAC3/GANP/Nin1/mts3/eIF-3 p25 family-domain-containing protein n=1 Tax=Ampelomyces quisqualis TaxID=50730 RepID=A0A6A5QJ11_AMPQU|nr:SAC3/GANP/Nin1/mts3/eIF-3 p25 family-domain-containing protein [Ampelomyces quisqualis]
MSTRRGGRGGRGARGGYSANTNGRATHATLSTPLADHTGSPNSTPFAQDDYSKRLDHIKAMRPKLRQRFVKEGRMNPDGQMRLSDSVKLIGLCTDMCPEYERVRRIVEDDVKPPECTPATEHLPRKQRIPDETRMVKAYARSAAGMDVELVSEIRSPATCLKTIDYLMKRLDTDEFDFLHSWIWDRTRAVRKDLRTQRIERRSDINLLLTCLERSARFLLLATHQMARSSKEDYSHQQDIEQLNQTLMSLQERYIDNRRVGYPSENEAEFWAYRLILAPLFTNTQYENELHRLPSDLRNNARVKTAIDIYRSMKAVIFTKSSSFIQAQANWKRFWELIKSPSVSYLMACAAEVSFQRVRHVVLDTLWRVYRIGSTSKPQTVETWTTPRVRDVLGLDKDSEAVQLCEAYGFQFSSTNGGPTFLDVTAKGFARIPLSLPADLKPQIFSQGIVEQKRYNRAFSAVVRALSVQHAKNNGLMIDSIHKEVEDDTSLFVPEAPLVSSNPFAKGLSDTPALIPATNPFLPRQPSTPSSGVPATNPFLKAIDRAPGTAPSNPFLPKPQAPAPTSRGQGASGVQPGLFDVSKDSVKFAPLVTSSTPFANADKPNPFLPAATSTPTATPAAATSTPPAAAAKLFTQNTQTVAQESAATPASTSTSAFIFPGFVGGSEKPSTPSTSFSFTPAGTPAPAAHATQDAEKQKVEEEARRRKAESEAEAQRKRMREEEVRQQMERQRIEAEQNRRRLQEEERNRAVREAQERQRREKESRSAKVHARERGYDMLAEDIMADAEEGLMMQFLENLVGRTAEYASVVVEKEKKRVVFEKRQVVADAMYEQRMLGLKRLIMANWIAKIEKKKRARQARERRRRLKEQKEIMTNTEMADHETTAPTASEAVSDPANIENAFRKPQAPASTRRAKRTEERRRGSSSQPSQQIVAQTALTPVSMSSTHMSNSGYSEAYYNSRAPMDRTEGDYFALRALGLDPCRLRKRSFDSSEEEDGPEIEPKRPRMSPSTLAQPPEPPLSKSTTDRRARFEALEQQFRKSDGLSQANMNAASFNGSSSLNKRSSLIEQAKQVLSRSRSTRESPTKVPHDYGRNALNLHRRAASLQQPYLGDSIATAANKERAAYWYRSSKFVPKPLYGQGPEAIRAYREKYGLSSPANSRPNSIEPSFSSPALDAMQQSPAIPTQLSYVPVKGYTQEQYSEVDEEEDSSGVEVVDVDAEDDHSATPEEEYEGDEETEDDEETSESEDEDGDSAMEDEGGFQHANAFSNGQWTHGEHETYDESTEEEEESESFQHTQKPGGTEDDAIELSD